MPVPALLHREATAPRVPYGRRCQTSENWILVDVGADVLLVDRPLDEHTEEAPALQRTIPLAPPVEAARVGTVDALEGTRQLTAAADQEMYVGVKEGECQDVQLAPPLGSRETGLVEANVLLVIEHRSLGDATDRDVKHGTGDVGSRTARHRPGPRDRRRAVTRVPDPAQRSPAGATRGAGSGSAGRPRDVEAP